MLVRQFAFIRVKKQVLSDWEFPLTHDETSESPIAGSFDAHEMNRIDRAVGRFPFASRTGDGRRAWKIEPPGRGSIEVWLTSDGNVFVQGAASLNVVYTLYVHVLAALPQLVAVEDRITGVLHDSLSLLRLVRRDEGKAALELPAAHHTAVTPRLVWAVAKLRN